MSSIKLSERLTRVASNVKSGGVVADIGCDHGFTSIYMVQRGIALSAIAMDIGRGPLQMAKEHIHEYGMEDRISARLSDGAAGLVPGEADTILISGMGGALITKILSDSIPVVEAVDELVLSPQSEIYLVRHFLHEHGFRIAHEEMLFEAPKYYVIIRAVRGEESYDDEKYYIYGKGLIDSHDSVFAAYLFSEEKRLSGVIKSLQGKKLSEASELKLEKIKAEISMIHGIMADMEK